MTTPAPLPTDPSTVESNPGRATRGLFIVAALVVVVGGMRLAAPMLVPVLLAACVAIAATPALLWLGKRGVPRALGMVIILIGVCAVFALFGWLLGNAVIEFRAALPLYQQRLLGIEHDALAFAAKWGVEMPDGKLFGGADAKSVMAIATTWVSQLAGLLSSLVLVLLIVAFVLAEASALRDKMLVAFSHRGDHEALRGFVGEVQKYLSVKTATSAATGLLVGIWCAVLGVDFALLWGVGAFMLNYVPTIGSILAAVPPVGVALLQYGPGTALATAAGYLLVNGVIGNVIEPRVMGRTLGLSPLVVLLSMLFWGWVLGVVGALLAVPLTMILKIGLEMSPEFRYVAVLMGPAVRKSP